MRAILPCLLAALAFAPIVPAQKPVDYHLVRILPIDAEKGVDYLYFDQSARRLYITHGTSVIVVDIDKNTIAGRIDGLNRVHGFAITPFNHGFVTSGNNSIVRMFDLKTLATLADIPAPGGPDGIIYEPSTARVFAFDHKGGMLTVIDAKTGAIAGSAQLGGQPEFPATDGHGTVWVNQEDKSTLLQIDAKTMKQVAAFPDAPCEGPTGMVYDPVHKRLFVGCGNEKMAVIDPANGKVVAMLPIGVHTDATHFDPTTRLIFNANRSNVTVIHQEGADRYTVVQNYATLGRANTLAIDEKTHHVFAAGNLAPEDLAHLPASVDPSTVPAGTFILQEYAP